jgi:glycosyltransferase involved in cell wall biosynthesis
MKALIFEPDGHGHRFHYVAAMLPGLLEAGATVTIAVPRNVEERPEYQLHLKRFEGQVRFDNSIPPLPGRPLAIAKAKIRHFRDAISRNQPDHLYLPQADGMSQMLGAIPGLWSWVMPRGLFSEALLLSGTFAYGLPGVKARMKSKLSWAAAVRPPWSILYHLDPVVYQQACRRGLNAARPFFVMPEPVETPARPGRQAILVRYGLPHDGRYIGAMGLIDLRKGMDRLIRAFATAKLASTDRLLLLGPQEPAIAAMLAGEFAPLVRSGRIQAIDRPLAAQEMADCIDAIDVVCATYLRHLAPSSIVVRAAAAEKPVLAADYGWTGHMVRKFKLGRLVNVLDHEALVNALPIALEEAAAFRLTSGARKFVQFNSIANFNATWATGVRQRLGLPPMPGRLSWDDVLDED